MTSFKISEMETRGTTTRTKKIPHRNGKITSETLNFRKVARQVMLANMFTKRPLQQPNVKKNSTYKSTAVDHHGHKPKRERKHNNSAMEKPSLHRKGTPELFPMSEEMKQTMISLGRLDLLPEERKARGSSFAEEVKVQKSQSNGTFREKTRRRIIHPQRFIRNVQSSISNAKRILEDSEETENEEISTENGTTKTTSEDVTNGINSADESDAKLNRIKTNNNIVPTPQTSTYCSTKSARNQRCSSCNKRPSYLSRFSDIGPLSATQPRITQLRTWPTRAHDTTRMWTRTNYFPKISRRYTFSGKEWANYSKSAEIEEKNNDELLRTRQWKSVENLTREIEDKCLTWLENRYGLPQY